MTTEESLNELHNLRTQVLDRLSGMIDQLGANDTIGFDAMLAIARSTGRPEFLNKAYELCQKMPESPEKADAMLELLGEIEVQMSVLAGPDDSAPQEATPANPDNRSEEQSGEVAPQ